MEFGSYEETGSARTAGPQRPDNQTLLLPLERSSEKLLHLDLRRYVRPDSQPDPVPLVEDGHEGEQQLQNSSTKPLHAEKPPYSERETPGGAEPGRKV
jgi:hypothetical protein